jgi:hypothetical protein
MVRLVVSGFSISVFYFFIFHSESDSGNRLDFPGPDQLANGLMEFGYSDTVAMGGSKNPWKG